MKRFCIHFTCSSLRLGKVVHKWAIDHHLLREARMHAILFIHVKVFVIEIGYAVVETLTGCVKEVSLGWLEVDEFCIFSAFHIDLCVFAFNYKFQENNWLHLIIRITKCVRTVLVAVRLTAHSKVIRTHHCSTRPIRATRAIGLDITHLVVKSPL